MHAWLLSGIFLVQFLLSHFIQLYFSYIRSPFVVLFVVFVFA